MRMWDVPVKLLCDRHLLGEHVEMHMFAGTIVKGISIQGYINKGLVNPANINQRHKELSIEMIERGMTHKSPLHLSIKMPTFFVDSEKNKLELMKRCIMCYERIIK